MKWTPNEGVWHPGAMRYPGLGLRRGKLEQRTLDEITHIIIHHTGVGVLGRFNRDRQRFGWSLPIQAAIHVYTKIMNSSGHYVIGHEGQVVQCVPDDWAAWHAGYGSERRRSKLAEWYARVKFTAKKGKRPAWVCRRDGRFDWWDVRWRVRGAPDVRGEIVKVSSPAEWFPDLDVNRRSIGIELLSTPGREPFTELQIQSLRQLVTDLCREYGIPLDNHHVLTHSDVCPLSRTTKGGEPWDPPPAKYTFKVVFDRGTP